MTEKALGWKPEIVNNSLGFDMKKEEPKPEPKKEKTVDDLILNLEEERLKLKQRLSEIESALSVIRSVS